MTQASLRDPKPPQGQHTRLLRRQSQPHKKPQKSPLQTSCALGKAARGWGWGWDGDRQGGWKGWGHHTAWPRSHHSALEASPYQCHNPVSPIHPRAGVMPESGMVGMRMLHTGVMLAQAPVCVVPNLPPGIKGSAMRAAALSSHITHTTSMLHCDNGV